MEWFLFPQVEMFQPLAAISGAVDDRNLRSGADAGMQDSSAPESTRNLYPVMRSYAVSFFLPYVLQLPFMTVIDSVVFSVCLGHMSRVTG